MAHGTLSAEKKGGGKGLCGYFFAKIKKEKKRKREKYRKERMSVVHSLKA